MKTCSKCGKQKEYSQFYTRKGSKDEYRNECIECLSRHKKTVHQKYKRERNLKCKEYDASHRKEKYAYNKEYYDKNRAKIIKQNDTYKQNRRNTDLLYRLADNQRARLYMAIKSNQKVGSAIRDLGCSISELKEHLEKQWQEGMTWDNWTLAGWHIDHIRPLALFNLDDPLQLREAVHYTNLQPLWAQDNFSKGKKALDNSPT